MILMLYSQNVAQHRPLLQDIGNERGRERDLMWRCHRCCGSVSLDQYSIRQNWATALPHSAFLSFCWFHWLHKQQRIWSGIIRGNLKLCRRSHFLRQLWSLSSEMKEKLAALSGLTSTSGTIFFTFSNVYLYLILSFLTIIYPNKTI